MPRRLFLLALFTSLTGLISAAEFDGATAANQLGLDLYRQLAAKNPNGNLVLSPYSITSALALAYAGADGTTRTEMAAALHFPADDASLKSSLGALRSALDEMARRSILLAEKRSRHDGSTEAIEWHAANRLYAQSDHPFRAAFIELMKGGFDAPFGPLDFKANPELARSTINNWIGGQTRDKIRDLIPAGGINARTRLVLANALYLKAPWQEPFGKSSTRPEPFHLRDGSVSTVSTMHQTGSLGYVSESGLTVVALEYLGGDLQFLILLPDAKVPLDTAAKELTPQNLARWAQLGRQTPPTPVSLYLPKFRIDGTTLPLGRTLRTLGMRSAFDEPRGSANFDRIAPRRPDDYLAISEVFHQTFIVVDEEGTEAAAATAVGVLTLGAVRRSPQPIEVRVDRPFFFAIQHRASSACLFLGRVTDPR